MSSSDPHTAPQALRAALRRIAGACPALLHLAALALIATVMLLAPHTASATPADSTTTVRRFDDQAIQQYKDDPDFDYDRDDLNTSWWQRFKDWLRHLFDDVDPDMPDVDVPDAPNLSWVAVLGKLIMVVVIVALVAGIVFLIVKGSTSLFKGGKDKADDQEITAEEREEDINQMPIADMLSAAIEGGQWRTAVRILYLRSLKALSDNGHILWESQKTNHDYLREVQDPGLKPLFTDLTRTFEYIWYGEFPVDKAIFESTNEAFTAFDRQIRRKP